VGSGGSDGTVAARVQPSLLRHSGPQAAMSPVAASHHCCDSGRLRPAIQAVEAGAVLFEVYDPRHRVGGRPSVPIASTAFGE